jgi:hypothetical protein
MIFKMNILLVGLCILLCTFHSSLAQDNSQNTTTPVFKHILVFVLENQDFWMCNLNSKLLSLEKKGTLLTNYRAITHPSQPNYIAMIAGSTMGVTSDSNTDVEGTSIVDLLAQKNLTWKAYEENYPGGCFAGESSDTYRRKHNPFISFNNIRYVHFPPHHFLNVFPFPLHCMLSWSYLSVIIVFSLLFLFVQLIAVNMN